MLSSTITITNPEGSTGSEQSTRRRGLSYLRSLSSHSSSAASPDQPRISPRHFFQRSTSYNEPKSKPPIGRRRSNSRPDEPTSAPVDPRSLTRVLSAGNPPISPSDSSSADEQREGRTQERADEVAENDEMTRHRQNGSRRATDSAAPTATAPTRPTMTTRNASTNDVSDANHSPAIEDTGKGQAPTIRFCPHQDLRNGRQSLNFTPVSRTLPGESSIIRVGRYSEREGLPIANPTVPSDAPVGFKSKVVSRKHCEFSFVDGQWQIRDVASSSGTFLNHIRLSQPNQESRLFPIKDGDIVQLGIDFRGGEEMIFRCVKIRIECNRSWQKKPNTFNKTRRAQLLGLAKDQPVAGQNSGECSICLGSVLPNQSLFVAPCAHVWHYKCIRPMLEGRQSQWPHFQCPNCRAWADLDADVDVAEEEMDAWLDNANDTDDHLDIDQADRPQISADVNVLEVNTADAEITPISTEDQSVDMPPATSQSMPTASGGLLARRAAAHHESAHSSGLNGIEMPARPDQEEMEQQLAQQRTRTESPNAEQIIAGEGPLTPRNNAGPFVFDGSGGSGNSRRLTVPGLQDITEGRQL